MIHNDYELDAWKVEAYKIFSPLDKIVGIPTTIDSDMKDYKDYKNYNRYYQNSNVIVPNIQFSESKQIPPNQKADYILPFKNDVTTVDILTVYDYSREYNFEDTEAFEYLMAMDYHEILPIADIEFPDVGDYVMTACQASPNGWFESLSDFYHWLHRGNKLSTSHIDHIMTELSINRENIYNDDNMKRLYEYLKNKYGSFDTMVSVGQVTGYTNTHFTFDANLLPGCEGSVVINLSTKGFNYNTKTNMPLSMKYMGVVVAGNPKTNNNVGQFNFDYNNHVFNNTAEEFNKVSDKISNFNQILKDRKMQSQIAKESNVILLKLEYFIEYLKSKILWILMALIFVIIIIVLGQKRKDYDKMM